MQLHGQPCAHCHRRVATTLDHDPPLAVHVHREGSGCCRLIPSCEPCNRRGGVAVKQGWWRPDAVLVDEPEPVDEPVGFGPRDECWRVPWLRGLRRVPSDAVWPRLMTVPSPQAVGSLGPEFSKWAEKRSGRPLRWWQRLVATRLLETDADGRLCWETLILTLARQLGKSWLLRELILWRIHQGERFGEPQDVIHTGKDLAICMEVQRPARGWAKHPDRADRFHVLEANGKEKIEYLEDGSRWLLKSKGAPYGFAVSVGVIDEAWKVHPHEVDEGLVPTMVEREQPQIYLVSTAHRAATTLMIGRRQAAIEALEMGTGDLLIEWSAPRSFDIDDVHGWRLASPHWTPQREKLIQRQLEVMRAGQIDDPEEPDPVESFRAQWLNQWPLTRSNASGPIEDLLPAGVWADRTEPGLNGTGPLWVAVEDDYGMGAAVAACARLDDGRLELDGWTFDGANAWDSALEDVQRLREQRTIRQLRVGASLLDRMPQRTRPAPIPAGTKETRLGLALLRDLALGGQLVHDQTTVELDYAFELARVRQGPAGLTLMARGPTHLVRAAVWAVAGAHRSVATPAIR